MKTKRRDRTHERATGKEAAKARVEASPRTKEESARRAGAAKGRSRKPSAKKEVQIEAPLTRDAAGHVEGDTHRAPGEGVVSGVRGGQASRGEEPVSVPVPEVSGAVEEVEEEEVRVPGEREGTRGSERGEAARVGSVFVIGRGDEPYLNLLLAETELLTEDESIEEPPYGRATLHAPRKGREAVVCLEIPGGTRGYVRRSVIRPETHLILTTVKSFR